MLFPLMVGIAAGVALERYYLSDEKKDGDKKKEEKVCDDKEKQGDGVKSSIMDFINSAKRNHPAILPRRAAAKKLLLILEGGNGEISKETFERTKDVVEEYCGIRKLEYDEKAKSVCGGEINEECPETPVLSLSKLNCLTREELNLIAPKLKGLYKTEE